jgi:hypothetical protein
MASLPAIAHPEQDTRTIHEALASNRPVGGEAA